MKVIAKVSFSAIDLSMYAGEVKEVSEKALLTDLMQAGYVEEVKTVKKAVKESESK